MREFVPAKCGWHYHPPHLEPLEPERMRVKKRVDPRAYEAGEKALLAGERAVDVATDEIDEILRTAREITGQPTLSSSHVDPRAYEAGEMALLAGERAVDVATDEIDEILRTARGLFASNVSHVSPPRPKRRSLGTAFRLSDELNDVIQRGNKDALDIAMHCDAHQPGWALIQGSPPKLTLDPPIPFIGTPVAKVVFSSPVETKPLPSLPEWKPLPLSSAALFNTAKQPPPPEPQQPPLPQWKPLPLSSAALFNTAKQPPPPEPQQPPLPQWKPLSPSSASVFNTVKQPPPPEPSMPSKDVHDRGSSPRQIDAHDQATSPLSLSALSVRNKACSPVPQPRFTDRGSSPQEIDPPVMQHTDWKQRAAELPPTPRPPPPQPAPTPQVVSLGAYHGSLSNAASVGRAAFNRAMEIESKARIQQTEPDTTRIQAAWEDAQLALRARREAEEQVIESKNALEREKKRLELEREAEQKATEERIRQHNAEANLKTIRDEHDAVIRQGEIDRMKRQKEEEMHWKALLEESTSDWKRVSGDPVFELPNVQNVAVDDLFEWDDQRRKASNDEQNAKVQALLSRIAKIEKAVVTPSVNRKQVIHKKKATPDVHKKDPVAKSKSSVCWDPSVSRARRAAAAQALQEAVDALNEAKGQRQQPSLVSHQSHTSQKSFASSVHRLSDRNVSFAVATGKYVGGWLLQAKHDPRKCTRVEFQVEVDDQGVPMQREPMTAVDAWCVLEDGKRLFVGAIAVPYSDKGDCLFPPIVGAHMLDAEPHAIPTDIALGKLSALPLNRLCGGGWRTQGGHNGRGARDGGPVQNPPGGRGVAQLHGGGGSGGVIVQQHRQWLVFRLGEGERALLDAVHACHL